VLRKGKDGVEVELGVAEVQIAIGQKKCIAAMEVAVQLEGRVVAPAGERTAKGGGEAWGGELDGEESRLGWTTEGPTADQRRESADSDPGQVGIGGRDAVRRRDSIASKGLKDQRGKIGIAAAS